MCKDFQVGSPLKFESSYTHTHLYTQTLNIWPTMNDICSDRLSGYACIKFEFSVQVNITHCQPKLMFSICGYRCAWVQTLLDSQPENLCTCTENSIHQGSPKGIPRMTYCHLWLLVRCCNYLYIMLRAGASKICVTFIQDG